MLMLALVIVWTIAAALMVFGVALLIKTSRRWRRLTEPDFLSVTRHEDAALGRSWVTPQTPLPPVIDVSVEVYDDAVTLLKEWGYRSVSWEPTTRNTRMVRGRWLWALHRAGRFGWSARRVVLHRLYRWSLLWLACDASVASTWRDWRPWVPSRWRPAHWRGYRGQP